MHRHRLTAAISAVLLAALLIGFSGFRLDQTYASGGTITVKLGTFEGLPEDTEFTYDLYKVGHFNGAKLELDDAYAGSHVLVDIPYGDDYKAEDYGGSSWEETWLKSAKSLETYIKSPEFAPDTAPESIGGTHTLTQGSSFSQAVGDNGLYFVMSDTVRVGNVNWTPAPMFIMVLNGDSGVNVDNTVAQKIESRPVTFEHRVTKVWNIPEGIDESRVRPSEIKVRILYAGEEVDTVTLNGDNNWSYAWLSEETGDEYSYRTVADQGAETPVTTAVLNESNGWKTTFTPAEGDSIWSVVEVFDPSGIEGLTEEEQTAMARLNRNFTVDYETPSAAADEGTPELFKVTNTYSVTELQLTKKIDGIVDSGDTSNITMGFKVVGKDAGGNEIYTNYAGVTFSKDDTIGEDGKYSKTTTVTGIPVNTATIEVTELYSSGYSGETGAVQATRGEDGIWTVTLNNTHGPHNGSGVVNKYVDGNITEQQGLNSGN